MSEPKPEKWLSRCCKAEAASWVSHITWLEFHRDGDIWCWDGKCSKCGAVATFEKEEK